MNKLAVKKIKACCGVTAETLSALFDKENIEFHAIDNVNWKEYPYKPEVKFRIAHTDNAILVNYQVKEKSVRAKYGEDDGSVWIDSCAEFFVIPAGDGVYYNIECNCIGTVLVGVGKVRNDRERAPREVTSRIQRWSSLGSLPFDERVGECAWELSLVIPYSVFYHHELNTLDGAEIKGNFYKCGDELQTPHFLSWNKIEIEKPDFHRPDFFGNLRFE